MWKPKKPMVTLDKLNEGRRRRPAVPQPALVGFPESLPSLALLLAGSCPRRSVSHGPESAGAAAESTRGGKGIYIPMSKVGDQAAGGLARGGCHFARV